MVFIEHVARLTSKVSAPFLDQALKTLSSSKRINNFIISQSTAGKMDGTEIHDKLLYLFENLGRF